MYLKLEFDIYILSVEFFLPCDNNFQRKNIQKGWKTLRDFFFFVISFLLIKSYPEAN